MTANYVTKVEIIIRPALDSDLEWLWTARVFTSHRGEAFARVNGVGISPEDAADEASARLNELIEAALLLPAEGQA